MTTDERIASIRVGNTRVYPTVNQDDVAFLLAELDAAQKREQAQQAAWDRDWQAAVAAHDKCVAELNAARARAATLREALEQLVHAIEAHQAQAWATSDIDTSAARAALAAGEEPKP